MSPLAPAPKRPLTSVLDVPVAGGRSRAGAQSKTEYWFVYILRCGDDTLYTGVARDVQARLAAHACGRGARYTRSRGPLKLCKIRRCASRGDALRLEYAIKQLSRRDKEQLLLGRGLATFARRLIDRRTTAGAPPVRARRADTRARDRSAAGA